MRLDKRTGDGNSNLDKRNEDCRDILREEMQSIAS